MSRYLPGRKERVASEGKASERGQVIKACVKGGSDPTSNRKPLTAMSGTVLHILVVFLDLILMTIK